MLRFYLYYFIYGYLAEHETLGSVSASAAGNIWWLINTIRLVAEAGRFRPAMENTSLQSDVWNDVTTSPPDDLASSVRDLVLKVV